MLSGLQLQKCIIRFSIKNLTACSFNFTHYQVLLQHTESAS